MTRRFRLQALLPAAVAAAAATIASEIAPIRVVEAPGISAPPVWVFSERTVRAAIEVDRDGARLVSWTLDAIPFARTLARDEAPPPAGASRLEIVLGGDSGGTHAERLDIGPICFEHPALEPPHVLGDTIAVHRDTVVVALPERADLDRLEISRVEKGGAGAERRVLARERLDAARFTGAGTATRYEDARFARKGPEAEVPLATATSGKVYWPEEFDDPDRILVRGDAAESDRRASIVVVPDGYTYAQKLLMRQHFEQLVAALRGRTPFREHDLLLNYVLVHAYSAESDADQCDCGVVKDTAMGAYFPNSNPVCGHGENRCLYYGLGCDVDSSTHIAEAELRVPGFSRGQGDRTVVMVNTARYGGCGGLRAVYSAGNAAATEVAIHELGHSFAGLSDEYQSYTTCGLGAGEINTSTNAVTGAWPEWIPDLGAPRQGAEYYALCVYRPQTSCEMRSLGVPFCPVCTQRWSLVLFGSPRVTPTAPIAAATPAPAVSTATDAPVTFSVSTRLGLFTTNEIDWQVQGPDGSAPVTVATGVTTLTRTFPDPGAYTVTCRVVADTNFVKPARNGPNVDVATWTVTSSLLPPLEISPAGSSSPLLFNDRTTLVWDGAPHSRASSFNLYRGDLGGLASGDYGTCRLAALATATATDPDDPSEGACHAYLVTGVNSSGEGPLGPASAVPVRPNLHPCPE